MSNQGTYYAGQHPASQPAGPSFNNNNLASNNPFRNRTTTSPASLDAAFASSASPFDDPQPPQRPLSRNPFLDGSSAQARQFNQAPQRPDTHSPSAEDIFVGGAFPIRPCGSAVVPVAADANDNDNDNDNDNAAAAAAAAAAWPRTSTLITAWTCWANASMLLQGSLTIDERNANQLIDFAPVDSPPRQQRPPQRAGENQPPARVANNRHRPTHSQEEALRTRKPSFGITKPPFPSTLPHRKPQQRPRRNSDSSLMDFDSKRQSDDDKAASGAKRQDREPRRPDGKEKPRTGRPSRKMDIIDQLDATSIYGTGLFHHDGPFDALNPHRNRQNGRRLAPMQAFPKDSLNNTLGGAGPLNPRADHSQFMGHGTDEAFNDFATTGGKSSYGYSSSKDTAIFDPVARGNIVHGDETYGLGTSTFLEGTPAARSAIVRREAEHQQEMAEGGLQRKKSLAQRIRQINRGPREHNPGRSVDQSRFGTSLGSEGGHYSSESNQANDSVNTKKGRDGRASPPPVPRPRSGSHSEQRAAHDTVTGGSGEAPAKPSGLLGRMKSMKGGRRPARIETP